MGTVKWSGAVSTDPDTTGNWNTGIVPTTLDDVVFDETSDGQRDCDFTLFSTQSFSWLSVTVSDKFTKKVIFASTTKMTLTSGGLIAKRGGWLSSTGSGSTISFTGTPPFANKLSNGTNGTLSFYIKLLGQEAGGGTGEELDYPYNTNGIFIGDITALVDNNLGTLTSRSRFTFEFSPIPSSKLVFVNGVYPNISILNPASGTATLSPTHFYCSYDSTQTTPQSNDNLFQKVMFRGLSLASNVTVSPATKDFMDFEKWFQISGLLQVSSSTFDWGYSTVEMIPIGDTYFPVNGDTSYGGTSKKFNASYNNLIISAGHLETNAFYLRDGMVLTCNSLTVYGKIYASAAYGTTSSAEIHTIERPIVEGDWNFQQIADGIYRARGTNPKAGVPSGGTGQEFVEVGSILYGEGHNALTKLAVGSAGQVLTVSGTAKPEWAVVSSGGSGCGLLDIGSLTNSQDVTIEMGNLVCS